MFFSRHASWWRANHQLTAEINRIEKSGIHGWGAGFLLQIRGWFPGSVCCMFLLSKYYLIFNLYLVLLMRPNGVRILNLPFPCVFLARPLFHVLPFTFWLVCWQEYVAEGTVKQNYVNILLMLLRLRQACDHPLLIRGYNSSSAWRSTVEKAKKLPREKQVCLLNCLEASLAICGICNVCGSWPFHGNFWFLFISFFLIAERNSGRCSSWRCH